MNRSLSIVIFLLFSLLSQAQDIPEPMSPPRLVNDFANTFNNSERSALEQKLRNYNDTTSTQIYVVTVTDLKGYDVSDYAFRLGEKWGVGQKGKNNGVVILIKPRVGNERGRVFIAVGYGLEPVLTDARCGRIIDNYMLPYFKEDNYYRGVDSAVEALIKALSGQFEADKKDDGLGFDVCFTTFIIFILFMVVIAKRGKGNKGNRSFGRGGFPPIIGGGFGGGFGGGSSGGGSFGGGGGGSFGGGGAGRSW